MDLLVSLRMIAGTLSRTASSLKCISSSQPFYTPPGVGKSLKRSNETTTRRGLAKDGSTDIASLLSITTLTSNEGDMRTSGAAVLC